MASTLLKKFDCLEGLDSSVLGSDEDEEGFADSLPNEARDDADVRVQNGLHLEAVGQVGAAKVMRNSERPDDQVTALLTEILETFVSSNVLALEFYKHVHHE